MSFQGICDAPEKIASYYEVNDVSRFQLDRPVHRGPVDKENEFKVRETAVDQLMVSFISTSIVFFGRHNSASLSFSSLISFSQPLLKTLFFFSEVMVAWAPV